MSNLVHGKIYWRLKITLKAQLSVPETLVTSTSYFKRFMSGMAWLLNHNLEVSLIECYLRR